MSYSINGEAMVRSFAIPVWVTEKSIKIADANALKILMLIMSDTAKLKTPEELSELLGISLSAVGEAIEFWISEGILKSTATLENPLEESEQLKALRQQLVSQKKIYAPSEVATIFAENPELSEIRDNAESIKGKPLSRSELGDIATLVDHYGLSGHFILTVMGYCFEIGKRDIKTIRSTAESFFISGVDEDTIDRYVEERLEYYLCAGKIKELLGLKDRYFKERELKILESWKTTLHMSDELILYAYQVTLEENKGAVVIPYQNKILEQWAKQGISTLEAAQASVEAFRNKAVAVTTKSKRSNTKQQDTTEKTTSIYEDIENLIAAQMDEPW